MDAAIQGFALILDPFNIFLIFIAVLIGVCVGALPGLSSPMAVALLLPFSLSMEPVSAISMMAALYCAGTFGGSITAILINAPGAPPAVATAFDGYPMAKRGEAGRALGLAAVSSVTGGIFSLFIFLFLAPMLAEVALKFRPQEYFALAVFALSMLASISGTSSIRNLISGAIGVLIGTVGIHITTGVERFTFNSPELTEGINFIPVLIGLFAVGELLNQSQALDKTLERITSVVVKLPSIKEFVSMKWTIIRSSVLGTFIGILPAEGATVAALMGYNEAKRFSKNKEEFGKGAPEGIVGPEAANNAATGGAMVPTLALGIPGSATTALILAALIMHGFRPGPYLVRETPHIVYAIFGAMIIANFVPVIGWPEPRFFTDPDPQEFGRRFCVLLVGVPLPRHFDVGHWLQAFGFLMKRLALVPPRWFGLILGKLVEQNLSRAMIIYDNNWLRFFESPIVDGFLLLTAVSLFWPLISKIWKRN